MTDTTDMTDTMGMTDTTITTITVDGMISTASALLIDREGNEVGTAVFTTNADGGVNVAVKLTDFTEAADGERGIHLHQIGKCEPDFQAAGGHLNPDQLKHGSENPAGPHGGDLPNITVDADGNASYTTDNSLVTVSMSRTAMLDADGAALVIHMNPDDYITDPDGKSGTRIACGVVVAGETPTLPAASMMPPPEVVTSNTIQPAHRAVTDDLIAGLELPKGFTIEAVAQGLGNVRQMAEAENGDIYATRNMQGDVIVLRDLEDDGQDEAYTVVATDLPNIHGLAIQGDQVYMAATKEIYVGTLQDDGYIGDVEAIVTDLPDGGQHNKRSLFIGPDDLIYINVGSPCNACGDEVEERATLLQIMPDGSSRTIFAKGLRNTVGWDWHPETGALWAMDMGMDGRGDDQPPEELNLIEKGANYGWPYCYADQQVDKYTPGMPPGRTKAEFCATTVGSTLTYQAHSAPIGFHFYTGEQFPEEYRTGAFVVFRGSWNRQEPTGYKVVFLSFDEEGQPVEFQDFLTGFLIEDGLAHFGRPAFLLQAQDGSLLLSEDTNGVIYRITYTQ